jgi:hypothetical protein
VNAQVGNVGQHTRDAPIRLGFGSFVRRDAPWDAARWHARVLFFEALHHEVPRVLVKLHKDVLPIYIETAGSTHSPCSHLRSWGSVRVASPAFRLYLLPLRDALLHWARAVQLSGAGWVLDIALQTLQWVYDNKLGGESRIADLGWSYPPTPLPPLFRPDERREYERLRRAHGSTEQFYAFAQARGYRPAPHIRKPYAFLSQLARYQCARVRQTELALSSTPPVDQSTLRERLIRWSKFIDLPLRKAQPGRPRGTSRTSQRPSA